VAKQTNKKPFDKAIDKFSEIINSGILSPLEKLQNLLGLNFMEYFEKNKKEF